MLDELMAAAACALDATIERVLHELGIRWSADPAMTDEPTDPTAPWRRATVSEAATLTRERLNAWRDEALRTLSAQLVQFAPDDEAPTSDVARVDDVMIH
jgi:hypothetical protein